MNGFGQEVRDSFNALWKVDAKKIRMWKPD